MWISVGLRFEGLEFVEPSLLVLGLDACSRALKQLQDSRKAKTTGEYSWPTSRLDELKELAEGPHCICKYPILRTAISFADGEKAFEMLETRLRVLRPSYLN